MKKNTKVIITITTITVVIIMIIMLIKIWNSIRLIKHKT